MMAGVIDRRTLMGQVIAAAVLPELRGSAHAQENVQANIYGKFSGDARAVLDSFRSGDTGGLSRVASKLGFTYMTASIAFRESAGPLSVRELGRTDPMPSVAVILAGYTSKGMRDEFEGSGKAFWPDARTILGVHETETLKAELGANLLDCVGKLLEFSGSISQYIYVHTSEATNSNTKSPTTKAYLEGKYGLKIAYNSGRYAVADFNPDWLLIGSNANLLGNAVGQFLNLLSG